MAYWVCLGCGERWYLCDDGDVFSCIGVILVIFAIFSGCFKNYKKIISRGKGSFSSKAGYFCIHAATQGHFVAVSQVWIDLLRWLDGVPLGPESSHALARLTNG